MMLMMILAIMTMIKMMTVSLVRDRVRIRVNGEQEHDAATARSNKFSQVEFVTHVVYYEFEIFRLRGNTEITVVVCNSQYRKMVAPDL